MLVPLLLVAAVATPLPSEAVSWEAPAGCPDRAEIRARVDDMLATSGSGRREAVRLRMVVRPTETGFRLTASLTDESGALGRRVVHGVNCQDLASAAVLIAALAIDPEIVPPDEPVEADDSTRGEHDPGVDEGESEVDERGSDAVPEPLPSPSNNPAVRVPLAQPQPSDPRPQKTPRDLVGVVHLGVGLGLGRLAAPRPMALGRLGAGLEHGAFRGMLRVSGFGPSMGEVPGFSGGGRFGGWTGGIAGCGRTGGSPWTFVGCLGTDLGVAHGRGRGTQNTRNARSLWWGVEVEAAVEYALARRWSLTGSLDGVVTPVRTRFVVDGQGHACCVRWGAGLRLGVLARFGRSGASGDSDPVVRSRGRSSDAARDQR